MTWRIHADAGWASKIAVMKSIHILEGVQTHLCLDYVGNFDPEDLELGEAVQVYVTLPSGVDLVIDGRVARWLSADGVSLDG